MCVIHKKHINVSKLSAETDQSQKTSKTMLCCHSIETSIPLPPHQSLVSFTLILYGPGFAEIAENFPTEITIVNLVPG